MQGIKERLWAVKCGAKFCHIFFRSHTVFIDWLIDCDGFSDLMVPLHLGVIWQTLCAPYQCIGAVSLCYSSRWRPDWHFKCPLAPRKRAQKRMSVWSWSFTLSENVGWGIFLCSTRAQWTVWQPCETPCIYVKIFRVSYFTFGLMKDIHYILYIQLTY